MFKYFLLSLVVLLSVPQVSGHVLPTHKLAVNVKDDRLYVVAALPMSEIRFVMPVSRDDLEPALQAWFQEATRWTGIAADGYQDVRIELNWGHGDEPIVTCYGVISVPDDLDVLSFEPSQWFARVQGEALNALTYSVVNSSGGKAGPRQSRVVHAGDDDVNVSLRF
jgi:hypothetical protein